VGYAWNNVLLYAKGGVAVVDNRFSHTFTGTNFLINTANDTTWAATVGTPRDDRVTWRNPDFAAS